MTTELNFALLKWQQEVFKDTTRFKVVAAGRRCGKSRLSAVSLLIEGLNCPDGSAVMYIAPTLGQARTIMWDLLHELGRPVIKSSHVNNLEITLINGRKILVRGADNPDSLRGVSLVYVVLDECAFVKEDVWQKIIRASLSDKKGRALFISTPSGRQEYLSSFDTSGADVFKEEWFKLAEEPQYGSYIVAIDLAGFEEVGKNASASKKRLDETAIAIVKLEDNGNWWVHKIQHGRWDIRETAVNILKVIRDFEPTSIGIERGALKNAVLPYLTDLMRKNNVYSHIHDLTHGNKKKIDRVVWSLQGRMEHGRITFNESEDWSEFRDQLVMFPTAGVHDDLVDALSYIDQLAIANYNADYEEDEWEVFDKIAGY